MPAYLERMPAGIPGDVTRKADSTLEPGILGAHPVPHGSPVKLDSGKLVPLEEGDSAASIYGFLARPYPTQGVGNDFGPGAAPAGVARDVLRRGYMAVHLAAGSPGKGDAVFVRIAAATGKAVGDIEAALVADETVQIPATFMGAADADGNVEMAYNI